MMERDDGCRFTDTEPSSKELRHAVGCGAKDRKQGGRFQHTAARSQHDQDANETDGDGQSQRLMPTASRPGSEQPERR